MGAKMRALTLWMEKWVPCCWSPIKLLNYFGVAYTILVCLCLLIANGYFTCPEVYGEKECRGPVLFGYFIVAQVVANLFCFHYFAKYNRISALLPGRMNSISNEYSKFCVSCNETVPMRSHHCPLCKYCVLRKDHHCFMTGGCVGFGNQRYFITFLFWTSVGAYYGTTFSFAYLNTKFVPWWPFGWIDYIGPIALKKWMFMQHCSVFQLSACILFSIGVASTIGAFMFFLSQMFFAVKGTTMYDFSMRKEQGYRAFDSGTPLQRLKALFGRYWYLNFLFPQPWFRNQLSPEIANTLYSCYLKDL